MFLAWVKKPISRQPGSCASGREIIPLDSTAIHPESYSAAKQVINQAGIDLNDKPQSKQSALVRLSEKKTTEDLAASLKIGVPTLADIFKQLVQPGRDPREDLPKPFLSKDVLTEEDLVVGMELQGNSAECG